jgi:hypothetical protein
MSGSGFLLPNNASTRGKKFAHESADFMSVWDDDDRGRWVYYEICISFIFVTLRRPTRPVELSPGEWGLLRGLPYALLTLFLGWWGIPWGLIYTPLALWTNLSGGRELPPPAFLPTTAIQGQEDGHV